MGQKSRRRGTGVFRWLCITAVLGGCASDGDDNGAQDFPATIAGSTAMPPTAGMIVAGSMSASAGSQATTAGSGGSSATAGLAGAGGMAPTGGTSSAAGQSGSTAAEAGMGGTTAGSGADADGGAPDEPEGMTVCAGGTVGMDSDTAEFAGLNVSREY